MESKRKRISYILQKEGRLTGLVTSCVELRPETVLEEGLKRLEEEEEEEEDVSTG